MGSSSTLSAHGAAPHRMMGLLAGALAAPIFIDVLTGAIPVTYLFSVPPGRHAVGQPIHWGVLVGAAGFASLLTGVIRGRVPAQRLRPVVLLIVYWFALRYLIDLMKPSAPFATTTAYFAQTILPLGAFLLGAHVSPRTWIPTLLRVTTLTNVVVMTHASSAMLRGAPLNTAIQELSFIMPQFKDYYPALVAVGVALASHRSAVSTRLRIAFLASTVTILPTVWSRSGLLYIAVSGAIAYGMRPEPQSKTLFSAKGLATACLFLALVVVTAATLGVLGERLLESQSSTAESDLRRLAFAGQASEELAGSPIVGNGFVPSREYAVSGRTAEVNRLFPAHNQYLDYSLRGGVVPLILVVYLFVTVVRLSLGSVASSAVATDVRWLGRVTTGVVIATLVASPFQLYWVQSLSGMPIFMLCGAFCARLSATARPTAIEA